ncbi:DUF2164 domain-containing protein [Terriglobus sp.]|uniref:DUF2164 domain-containing protein n=1 Tax=Terriglobus sp. TaxID=1889013 RepID=UPI003AFFC671
MPTSLEISGPVRKQAISSLQQYAEANLSEPLGELAAGNLLDYFVEEIAPVIYNQAVTDVQDRLQQRIGELHGEVYAEPFQYWSRLEKRRKARRI